MKPHVSFIAQKMTLQKTDLHFDHYKWHDDEDLLNNQFNGAPSRRYFDPYNGNQVLFLINFYATKTPSFKLEDALVLESMIANKLPTDLKSEKSVFSWMEQMSVAAK